MICAAQQQHFNVDRMAPKMGSQSGRPTIAPMEQSSIQRIVAGQAVTDMASAVKELVDNALDAGAKTINIRLFNLGLDVIEVSDDGCGVPMESRPYMAMKHATSKIRSFDDIYSQDGAAMLGFRGEALFCLANLSRNLVVATRTASDVLAQKLEFQRDGTIRAGSSELIARKVGTTVAILHLFDALPVRRTDFSKRIQAQRTRLFHLLQGYATLCLGVRITLMDVGGSRGEEVRMRSSDLSTTLEQTVSSVLGSRFLTGLTSIAIDLPSDGGKVQGLVANLDSSIKDVQFFSINGRPVELPALTRAIAEVWRGFPTRKKRAACVLQLTLPSSGYDVNLSPDKRQVLLTDQDGIVQALQTKLQELWVAQGKVFQIKMTPESPRKSDCSPNKSSAVSPRRAKRRMAFVHDFNRAKLQHETEELQGKMKSQEVCQEADTASPPLDQQRPSDAERRQWTQTEQAFRRHRHQEEEEDPQRRSHAQTDFASRSKSSLSPRRTIEPAANSVKTATASPITPGANGATLRRAKNSKPLTLHDFAFRPVGESSFSMPTSTDLTIDIPSTASRAVRKVSLPNQRLPSVSQSPPQVPPPASAGVKRVSPHSSSEEESPAATKRQRIELQPMEQDEDNESSSSESETDEDADDVVTWDQFYGTEAVLEATKTLRVEEESRRRALKAQASSSTPSSSSVKLEKGDFAHMKILGQFNLGFILCLDQRNHHLWILDQHACDEKYNFERLCRDTKLQEQPLIKPILLRDLSPSEESCVLDHMDVFEANGFRFRFDPDQPPRARLWLTAMAYSKDVQFGPADVAALCAMLSNQGEEGHAVNSRQSGGGTGNDGSGLYGNNAVRRYAGVSSQTSTKSEAIVARLPKAIAMLASRACRGSIMIGSALSQQELTNVVTHLQQVEHPWNCPHGRPTLCHVQHMGQLLLRDAQRQAQLIAGPTVTMLTQQPSIDE